LLKYLEQPKAGMYAHLFPTKKTRIIKGAPFGNDNASKHRGTEGPTARISRLRELLDRRDSHNPRDIAPPSSGRTLDQELAYQNSALDNATGTVLRRVAQRRVDGVTYLKELDKEGLTIDSTYDDIDHIPLKPSPTDSPAAAPIRHPGLPPPPTHTSVDINDSVARLQAQGVSVRKNIPGGLGVAGILAREYPHVLPEDIISAVFGKAGSKYGVEMQVSNSGDITVQGNGVEVHGSMADSVMRGFSSDKGSVSHTLLELDSRDTGRGAVKKQFAASMDVYNDMGMSEVKVHGGLKNGFHTWARYGYDDDRPPEWEDQAHDMISTAKKKLKNLSPEAQQELNDLDALRIVHTGKPDYPRIMTAMKTPHLNRAWIDQKHGSRGEDSTFLSDAMAWGDWHGTIRLDNEDQMRHLGNYVGKSMPVKGKNYRVGGDIKV